MSDSPLPAHKTTVSFATLGCKTNQFESATMQQTLVDAGYQVVAFDSGAELVIVNTCTVTNATDAQSRNLIRRARKYNADCRVIVTGCYAQIDPQALSGLPGVSMVIGNEEKQQLLDYLGAQGELEAGQEPQATASDIRVSDIRKAETVCLTPLTSFAGRSRAFVQIQNGCDAFCSYCIIPYARGASRSAQPDEIIKQIQGLVDNGYPEVVLTGIHIGGYGADLPTTTTLLELIQRIEAQTSLQRLRLGSIEPTEISQQLIDAVAASSIICPHFHIPLQAGDDEVLTRMGRNYDTVFFAELIQRIRQACPDAAIVLDVITGFPGEDDAAFENTYGLIESLPITDLHVFPYSKRPGTPAATMPAQVSGDVSKSRAQRLRELAAQKHATFAEGFIGETLEVVVEHAPDGELLKGLSRNYLEVRFAGEEGLAGDCVKVLVARLDDGCMYSEIIA